MYKHLLKVFLQNILRNYFVSTINVAGLTIGLLSTLLILEYVLYQRSYETHNENASNVFRIAYKRSQNGKEQWNTAHSFFPAGLYLKNNYTEVDDYVTMTNKYNITVSYINQVNNKVIYNEAKTFHVNSAVFKLFGIPILTGSPNCLDEPNTVAISERAANKYFGNEDPLGKKIWVDFTENYTVTAVFQTIPENTHFKSDFFFSTQTLISQQPGLLQEWGNDIFYNYIMLKPGTDYKSFTTRAFPEMVKNNYERMLTMTNTSDDYYLQPIRNIHLKSNIENELDKPVNGKMVSILFGFSLFFLLVAWINYINMITARSIERAREIGIKKVNGAKRRSLILQFIGEAFLLNGFCLVIAWLFFMTLNPLFVSYTQIQPFSLKLHLNYVLAAGAIFLLGIVISAIYPAFVLSSYKPVEVLKGIFKNSPGAMFFRRSLVCFQFVISLILLTGTLVAYKQIKYLDNRDMGISYHSTMIVRSPKRGDLADEYTNKLTALKNSISQMTTVKQISIVSDIPGQEIDHYFYGWKKGFSPGDGQAYYMIYADDEFLDFYKIKFLSGNGFKKGEFPEQGNYIMNVAAMKRFGFEEPEKAVDQIMMSFDGREHKIIGITPDFSYYSKKVEAVPTIISLSNSTRDFISIRYDAPPDFDYESFVREVKLNFENVFSDRPFEYHFLDDSFKKDLKSDKTFMAIFGGFSFLAILISAIGISGLLLIVINQNMKELAIRKALGAKPGRIMVLISQPIIGSFILALVIATPLSYYGIKNWLLNNYIQQIVVNYKLFLFPAIFMVLVIVSIVIALSLRVKKMRIAEVLQYE